MALPTSMAGADLLVAVVMGDGPDNPADQHSVLADSGRHQWTLRDHHVVFGSIIDVYTAPGTGSEAGCTVSSEMTIKRGDEGHALSVLAYRNGRFDSTTDRNGNFTLPQLHQTVPAGEDVLTVFGDGRQNTPITLVARIPARQRAAHRRRSGRRSRSLPAQPTGARQGHGPVGTCSPATSPHPDRATGDWSTSTSPPPHEPAPRSVGRVQTAPACGGVRLGRFGQRSLPTH